MGSLARTGALVDFSVSTAAHTKRSATPFSDGSVNTNDCIDRHEWHHGAHRSTTTGTFLARAIDVATA